MNAPPQRLNEDAVIWPRTSPLSPKRQKIPTCLRRTELPSRNSSSRSVNWGVEEYRELEEGHVAEGRFLSSSGPVRGSKRHYPCHEAGKDELELKKRVSLSILDEKEEDVPKPEVLRPGGLCDCVGGCNGDSCSCAVNGIGCWWDAPGHGCGCAAASAGPGRCCNPFAEMNYRYDPKKVVRERARVMAKLHQADVRLAPAETLTRKHSLNRFTAKNLQQQVGLPDRRPPELPRPHLAALIEAMTLPAPAVPSQDVSPTTTPPLLCLAVTSEPPVGAAAAPATPSRRLVSPRASKANPQPPPLESMAMMSEPPVGAVAAAMPVPNIFKKCYGKPRGNVPWQL